MKGRIKNSTVVKCLKMVWSAASLRDKLSLTLVFVTAFAPSAVVLLEKTLFQKARLLPEGNSVTLRTALLLAVAIGVVTLLINIINNISSYVAGKLQISVRTRITGEMLDKLTTVELKTLEKPDVYEKLRLLSGTLDLQIRRSIDGIVKSVVAVITAMSLVPVLAAEDLLIAAIVALSSVPLFFFIKKQSLDE